MSWPQLSPAAAADELLKRRQARQSLLHFTNYTFPTYQADPFHALLADALDSVVNGDIDRLMIFAPPQHGKSELASVRFPAYWMGRRPDDPVILASYSADLATAKSRQARDIVESSEYRALFGDLGAQDVEPVKTRRDSRAVNEWRLAVPHRGGMRVAGVLGGLTGHPGKLGLIDDPFAGWSEAQSPTQRQKVWRWYQAVFRTRVWEGGAIVIIMTRWHEDDLAGRLLQSQPGRWTVLRLPALAESQAERDENNRLIGLGEGEPDPLGREPGEALAPGRFSREALEEIKVDVGTLVWGSEYQGCPRNLEGELIKRDWISQIVEAVPAKARRVRYWDKAGTEGGGKYSTGVLLAFGDDGLIYVEDVVRGQWSALGRERVIKQTAELDAARYGGPSAVAIWLEQEPGSGGKESAESTIRNLVGFNVHKEAPTGDKVTRGMPFAAQAEAGNVRLLRGAWNQAFIEELTAIPNGTYWDQFDATAGAFNKGSRGRVTVHQTADPFA